ncbi:MAG: hypothetical protein PUK85_09120, partial [Clostridia bacterium]|nr:hypothetical protein [Clostridia bacterium]
LYFSSDSAGITRQTFPYIPSCTYRFILMIPYPQGKINHFQEKLRPLFSFLSILLPIRDDNRQKQELYPHPVIFPAGAV